MRNIMRLELKKIAIKKYILSTLIALICIIALTLMTAYTMPADESPWNTAQDLLQSCSLFLRLFFTIFIGVMIANIIIKEYETGTVLILFLYPMPKKTILTSKLLLIVLISFIMMFSSYLISSVFISCFNNIFQLLPGTIDIIQFKSFMASSIFLMVITIATCMICLFVGLKTKSSVATIISAVIISLLINGQIGTAQRLTTNITLMVVLSVIGCLIVFLSVKNVNKEDIVL